jgi:glycerone phosphate O-acyltransferase
MDGFADLIEEIKSSGGEFMWVTKKKHFLENTDIFKKRTANEIKQKVLKSQRVSHVVDQMLEEKNVQLTRSREEILNEATQIVDEMAHDFDLKYVRMLGYALVKVFCKIYKHIYYNKDINANLQVMKHSPCLLLPLHRSYMDFLLVSIICFHKNLQLPAVATGMDFLGNQNC